MGKCTFWEKLEPTCHTGQARPAWQVWQHMPRGTSLVHCTSSPAGTTWLNKIDQGNIGLIEWMRFGSLGSVGPLVRSINRHNLHPKVILGVQSEGGSSHSTEQGWPHLEGQLHLPTVIPGETDPRNRPSTASGAVIRSVQGERPWITGPAAPLDPTAPVILGPCAQPTSLAYKRHLTLTRMDTQHWSISFPLFCSIRVGLV
jgi:hypothetical protein